MGFRSTARRGYDRFSEWKCDRRPFIRFSKTGPTLTLILTLILTHSPPTRADMMTAKYNKGKILPAAVHLRRFGQDSYFIGFPTDEKLENEITEHIEEIDPYSPSFTTHFSMWNPQSEPYRGQKRDGLRHGKGVFISITDGEKYDGEWRDDKRHGKGTLTLSNGTLMVGEWVGDRLHGRGTAHYPDGG